MECVMRKSVSTASACGPPSVWSATIAPAISARWSVASSTNSVRYFLRSTARSLLGLGQRLSDHVEHLVGLEWLDEVAARTGREHVLHQRFLTQRAAHHDAGARVALHDLAQRLEPALARHHDVE